MIKRPLLLALLALFAAVGLAVPALGLRTTNALEEWLPSGSEERTVYDRFRATFGSDDFAVVATVDRKEAGLAHETAALARRLRELRGVERVLAPVVHTVDGAPTLSGEEPFHGPLLATGESGVSVAVFVGLEHELDLGARQDLLESIEHVAGPDDGAWVVAGPPILGHALDRTSAEAFSVLAPAAGLGVLFVLILGLRNVRAALVVVTSTGLACGATLGLVALSGRSLHMVLSILPALLVVLGTAYAVHPVTRFLDEPVTDGETFSGRWARVLRTTRRPALVAAVTTAAGIGSLALADIGLVPDLGLFGAIGVLLAFGLAYTFVPAALMVLRVRPYGPVRSANGESPSGLLARFATRRAGPVVAVSAVVLILAAWGIARLPVESDVRRLLPEDAPVRQATATIESRLLGLTPLEIWLRGPTDVVLSETTAAAASAFADRCREHPLVTHVVSPYAERDALRLRFDTPMDDAAELVATLPSHVQSDADGGVTSVRMTILSNTVAVEETDRLVAHVRDLSAGRFPADVDVQLTGSMPLLVRLQSALVSSQVQSFAGAFVLVSLVLWLDLGSAALAGLALAPNLAPALVTAGAMGWLGVPLDAATVAVAGIAFGLAVDDTVHVLHGWTGLAGGLRAVYRTTGRAVVLTTLAAIGGFAAFALSSFPPARRLGLLVALSAVIAVAADLLLLPALLALLSRGRSLRARSPR